ncbi:MAG: hypothetical protein M0037_06755 [Betaproteobacteria bacterium]|nr:hypothetical protein [Betaproteobacteria bacterium]
MHIPDSNAMACKVAQVEARRWVNRELTAEELDQSRWCQAFKSREQQVILQGDACDGCARNKFGAMTGG